jgi:ech hydrogenase subunit D
MTEQLIGIDKKDLTAKAAEMSKNGFRLVQIGCTLTDSFEITYSFDKDYDLYNLRMTIPKTSPVIPSITESYLCAFTYENELQDLFGLTVTDMKLNFNGAFYQTAVKTPFNTGVPTNPEQKAK